jgi:hypothetical protein
MRRGIEFLRPLKSSKYKGTCSESERDVVEISLMKTIHRLSPPSPEGAGSAGASADATRMDVEMDNFDIDEHHAGA